MVAWLSFDEEKEANRQLRRNGIQGNVVNELGCRSSRRELANVNSELKALTEINRLQSEENASSFSRTRRSY